MSAPDRPAPAGLALPLLRTVDELRDAAVARLVVASGDVSLCTLARSGRPAPAAKYHEGAVAALSDVRRALRSPDAPGRDAVADVREQWEARRGTAPAASADWQAYLNGGTDALAELEPQAARDEPEPDPGLAQLARPGHPLALDAALARPARRGDSGLAVALRVLLIPLLLILLVSEGGGWDPAGAPLWTGLAVVTAVLAAGVVASYVRPRASCRGQDLTPCGLGPLLTLLAAGWFLGTGAHSVASAVAALGVVALGLALRLGGAACPPR